MQILSHKLHDSGELRYRIEQGLSLLAGCSLCPRKCGINRLTDETGFCGIGRRARISSFSPHFGEEDVLVGEHGSGTIFLGSCNLRCCFCQNYEISFNPEDGREVSSKELASIMLHLQDRGCHNINFVSPGHVVVQLLEAIEIALGSGLNIPLIYNSSGYDGLESLDLLDGVIDIYMPDFKFWQAETGEKYCAAPDYSAVAQKALVAMFDQVGDLVIDERGLATSGLLIRHLLMPDGMAETEKILSFIAEKISVKTYVNIMDQYRPCGESHKFSELQQTISAEDYQLALRYAKGIGLERIDKRDTAILLKRLGII